MSREVVAARAKLYHVLAEALAEPPEWLAGPGQQWPLFDAAIETANSENNALLGEAILDLVSVPAETLNERCVRYERLFLGAGRRDLPLYESLARDGKLAGPSTFAVWSAYQAAGLQVAGAELPDHASVELAFLGYLAAQEVAIPDETAQWCTARRLFIAQHAGEWLTKLGEALAQTADTVYGPIGRLLAAALVTDLPRHRISRSRAARRVPSLPEPEYCTLCSFCVQVCPTHALAIRETGDTTLLTLIASACVACKRCVRVCMTNALTLVAGDLLEDSRILRHSPRIRCRACGAPTISQAELDEVASRIGQQDWLAYCSACRALVVENP